MIIRSFVLILGIVFLMVGIAGFVPGLNHMHASPDPDLIVHGPGEGNLLGLFPVNLLHNLVHILFGIWGIAAYRTFSAARIYCRSVAVIYGILVIFGLVPMLSTTFGLIPIHGNDVWLHGLIAVAAAIMGWITVRAPDHGAGTAAPMGH